MSRGESAMIGDGLLTTRSESDDNAQVPARLHNGRNALLRELRAHEDQILQLKRTLNSQVHISTLPREILEEIFSLCMRTRCRKHGLNPCVPCTECDALNKNRPSFHHIVEISHVCHLWRTVALDSSQLWTIISTSYCAEFVKMVLSRSASRLLHVLIDSDIELYKEYTQRSFEQRLSVLWHETSRFEVLNILGWHGDMIACFDHYGHPLRLRRFTASLTWPDHAPAEYLASQVWPSLETLALRGVSFSQPISIRSFPALTELHLNSCYHPGSCAEDILEVLDGFPGLRTLSLWWSSDNNLDFVDGGPDLETELWSPDYVLSVRKVALPQLRSLELSDVCSLLLFNLELPINARITLSCTKEVEQGYCRKLASLLSSALARFPDAWPIQTVKLASARSTAADTPHLTFELTVEPDACPAQSSTVRCWIDTEDIGHGWSCIPSMVFETLAPVTTFRPRELYLEWDHCLDENRDAWRRLIPFLSHLEVLNTVGFVCTDSAITVLAEETTPECLPLLSLKKVVGSISWESMSLMRYNTHCGEQKKKVPLYSYLKARKDRGVMLEELDLDALWIFDVGKEFEHLMPLARKVTLREHRLTRTESHVHVHENMDVQDS